MKIAIKAEPRSVQGTGASRRLRRESKVPGVVYGANKDAQPIQLDHKELWFKLKMEAFHASILEMELGSEKSQVVLRDYQMHPFRPIILHADFLRVAADKKIHMKVPLHFVNAEISPGVKVAGGLVQHAMNELEILSLPKDVPVIAQKVTEGEEPTGGGGGGKDKPTVKDDKKNMKKAKKKSPATGGLDARRHNRRAFCFRKRMDDIRLIVGLGNPGEKYQRT